MTKTQRAAYRRAWNLRTQYGMTVQEYNRILRRQGGVCAICSRPPRTKRLAVDHDHKTGNTRGLLCSQCNRGLSFFHDNPDFFEKAADYLYTSS